MSFVHLHVHSEYSLSSSLVKIPQLVQKVMQQQSPAVAVTDWSNLYGCLNFYQNCKKTSEGTVKPIIGAELGVQIEGAGPFARHVVLLAKNQQGYQNLSALCTKAHITYGFQEGSLNPVLPLDELIKHKEGLILLTGGLKGILSSFVVQQQNTLAQDTLKILAKEFKGSLYLELQDSSLSFQKKCNDQLMDWGEQFKVPMVATCDVHYLEKEHATAQEVWMLCDQKVNLEESPKSPLMPNDFYLKSPEEMKEAFQYAPQAVENTLKIAEECNVEFNFVDKKGQRIYHIPDFDEGKGKKKRPQEEFFKEECDAGLAKRLAQNKITDKKQIAEYNKRLEFEVDVIANMGFAGYYLIVSDFIRWAKINLIPVGPGRGSGAGSLAAYCLDITNLDPLVNGLLFERFLNPERVSLPDFDIDFCQARRHEVIRYVSEKYGSERVSQIVTFAKEQSKNAIKDVGRVFGLSFGETNRLTKLIPSFRMKPLTIQETLDQVKEFSDIVKNDNRVGQVVEIAQIIEGSLRQPGVHAAGVIIASKPIKELSPMSCDVEGNPITQWDMKMSEEAGLVKFDFLGLVTLDLMDLACKLIRNRGEADTANLTYENIPIDDPRAYRLIANGDTLGVFQFESSGMQNICVRIQPNCFEDLCAINGLYRPGPLESGMVDDYIQSRKDPSKITYMFPEMEECLKETYGTIVYQEQVMQIARVVGGYSLGQADMLRKIMGKKIPEKMAAEQVRFVDGAVAKGKDREKAAELFGLIEKFAGYGFNKSHAAAYVMLAVQTAWLKSVYPTEFFAALLTIDKENTDKLSRYIVDAKKHDIEILPPDVNESFSDFSISGASIIRFGLAAIKNVGANAVDAIIEARKKHGPAKDVYEFLTRVDIKKLNRRMLECLIQSGAFDSLVNSGEEQTLTAKAKVRSLYLNNVEKILEWANKHHQQMASGQTSLFGGSGKDGAVDDLPKPRLEIGKSFSEGEMLSWEKALLGIYVSGSPLDKYLNKMKNLSALPIYKLVEKANKSDVVIAGMVTDFKELKVRRGKRAGQSMAVFKIEDFTGQVEMVSFPDHYAEFGELFRSSVPILVRSELEFEDGRPKLMGSQTRNGGKLAVEDLASIQERWPKEFSVDIHLDKLNNLMSSELMYGELAKLLGKFPGKTAVSIRIYKKQLFQTKIELGADFNVQPSSELEKQVKRIVSLPGCIDTELHF